MSDNVITENELWQDLINAFTAQSREEGEYTATEFARMTGRKRDSAAHFLEMKVEEGKVTRRKILENGHRVWIYKPVGK